MEPSKYHIRSLSLTHRSPLELENSARITTITLSIFWGPTPRSSIVLTVLLHGRLNPPGILTDRGKWIPETFKNRESQAILMEDSDCSASLSNLICQEDGSTLLLGDDDEEEKSDMVTVYNYGGIFSETEEDDYIDMLVSKESVCFESRAYDDSSEAWLKCARSDAVRWILKQTKAYFGFCSKTAYMAMAYLDRFLMHRRIDDAKIWAVRLLSVACLSLAAKMEECKVPALSEFGLEEYDFKSSVIQRMEFLVLNTLEWRLNSVTPFAYLSYFASKLQERKWNDLMARATGFIFAAATTVMNLVDYRPSVVAAAAILAAFDERLTQNLAEFKLRIISLRGSLETEHVFSCYRLMIQESHKEKLKPSKNLISWDLSAANCVSVNISVDAIANTSFTARSSKRRRLESPHA